MLNSIFVRKYSILFILLLAATSLIYSSAFVDVVGTPKAFWFYLVAGVFIALFLFIELTRHSIFKVRLNMVDIALLLFYFYILLRLIVTSNKSFENTYFISLTFLVHIYFVMRRLINRQENSGEFIDKIVFGFFIICGIQVIISFIQYAGYLGQMTLLFHITGCFGNPGILANYLVCVLPVALTYALATNKRHLKITARVVCFLILVLLPLTQARTAWIAAAISLLLVVGYKYRLLEWLKRNSNTIFKKVFLAAVCLIITVASVFALYQYKADSANGRVLIWKQSVEIIKDHPVFGVGFDKFSVIYPNYQAAYFKANPNDNKAAYLAGDNINAFNEYLEMGVELGLVGLLLFVAFLFLVLKRGLTHNSSLHKQSKIVGFTIAILAILISALFSYPIHDNTIILHLIVYSSIIASQIEPKSKSFTISRTGLQSVFILYLVLFVFFFRIQFQRFQAEKDWFRVALKTASGHWEPRSYDRLYNIMQYNPNFLYNYGAELSIQGEYRKSIVILKEAALNMNNTDLYYFLGNSYEAVGDMLNAKACFLKANYIMPHKFLPKYRLVHLYRETNQMEKAIKIARTLVNMKPKVDLPVVQDIKKEMQMFLDSQELDQ